MITDHFELIRQRDGLDAAYRAACDFIRERSIVMQAMWNSRFLELRTIEDGTKKLWPTTERVISMGYDQDDHGEPPSQYFYCDAGGQLHPVTVSDRRATTASPAGTAEVPFVCAIADLLANGQVVGHVHYTDH
jgi:hypothetical protein